MWNNFITWLKTKGMLGEVVLLFIFVVMLPYLLLVKIIGDKSK